MRERATSETTSAVSVYFSDFFEVDPATLERRGLVNVSLINDLPLFIDPFLIFNSTVPLIRRLHDELLKYLIFLRDKATKGQLSDGTLRAWLTFPEVRQTWLGFSMTGNGGRGLGMDFARKLAMNLSTVFATSGADGVARSNHLEKLCLIEGGVGRDKISDFTTNLVKYYILELSQEYAREHLAHQYRKTIMVGHSRFNYTTESWESNQYELPWHPFVNDYVLLTPKAFLTKSDTWINRGDLYHRFPEIAKSLPDQALRDQVNNYFALRLPAGDNKPTKSDIESAVVSTIRQFPQLLEYYIREREESGDRAVAESRKEVSDTEMAMIRQLGSLIMHLAAGQKFYEMPSNTYQETRERLIFLKQVIEDQGGHRIFYVGNTPIRKESDLHIMFRLTWFATPSDVTREANDGRGPADFKISRGALDKTIVEFKLASNSKLRSNLLKQLEIYKKASGARFGLKVIVFFSELEEAKLNAILRELGLSGNPDVILIDARADNKPSGSRAA